jgi:hypothetical protein
MKSLLYIASVGIAASLSILSGCAEWRARQEAAAAAQAQAIGANDDATCRSYGASPGSPAYVQCRMNISNQRAAGDMQTRALIGAYLLTH